MDVDAWKFLPEERERIYRCAANALQLLRSAAFDVLRATVLY
jgi:hypothetical protein